MPTKLTPEIIDAAILGLESQKDRLDLQIVELRACCLVAPNQLPSPRRKRSLVSAGNSPQRLDGE
jgi:hypothetical protein